MKKMMKQMRQVAMILGVLTAFALVAQPSGVDEPDTPTWTKVDQPDTPTWT